MQYSSRQQQNHIGTWDTTSKSANQHSFRAPTLIGQDTTSLRVPHMLEHINATILKNDKVAYDLECEQDERDFYTINRPGRSRIGEWKRRAGKNKSWKFPLEKRGSQSYTSHQHDVPVLLSRQSPKWEKNDHIDPENEKIELREPRKKKKHAKQGRATRLGKHVTQEALHAQYHDWRDACSEMIVTNPHVRGIQDQSFVISMCTKEDWERFEIIANMVLQPLPSALIWPDDKGWRGQLCSSDTLSAVNSGKLALEHFVQVSRETIKSMSEDAREFIVDFVFPPDHQFYWIMESIPSLQCYGIISIEEAESVEFILCRMRPWTEVKEQVSVSSDEPHASETGAEPGEEQHRRRPGKLLLQSVDHVQYENGSKNAPKNEVIPNLPRNYKWLSVSAKRRFRKHRQKAREELQESDSAKEKRKKLIKQGKTPYQHCYRVLHSFNCGHIISLLCRGCDEAWRRAELVPCQFYEQERLARPGRSALYRRFSTPLYRHFSTPCVKCPWSEHPPIPFSGHRTRIVSLVIPITSGKRGDSRRFEFQNLQNSYMRCKISPEGCCLLSSLYEEPISIGSFRGRPRCYHDIWDFEFDFEFDYDASYEPWEDEEPAYFWKNFQLLYYYH